MLIFLYLFFCFSSHFLHCYGSHSPFFYITPSRLPLTPPFIPPYLSPYPCIFLFFLPSNNFPSFIVRTFSFSFIYPLICQHIIFLYPSLSPSFFPSTHFLHIFNSSSVIFPFFLHGIFLWYVLFDFFFSSKPVGVWWYNWVCRYVRVVNISCLLLLTTSHSLTAKVLLPANSKTPYHPRTPTISHPTSLDPTSTSSPPSSYLPPASFQPSSTQGPSGR